jgi:nucleoid-associated protein YgaU
MADQWIMTAVGVAARPVAAPSVDLSGPVAALRSPTALSAVVVAGLAVVVVAQHPIARALGTEVAVPRPNAVASDPPAAAPPAGSSAVAAAPAPVVVPTHAPRDPFRALVAAAPAPTVVAVAAPRDPVAAPPAPAAATAPVTVATADHYVVQAGDSLWSIAHELLGPAATPAAIEALVTQIYRHNSGVIGADASLVYVGQTLDLAGLR